ncbi:MAG: hypothetical protein PHS14_19055 [Elusimicrobia bacterium]|nr:hypothetical protein [Elusimicrobiota bacterium]
MKKLSVRERGEGRYEVGPAGIGPTVTVLARGRREARKLAKSQISAIMRAEIRETVGKTRICSEAL